MARRKSNLADLLHEVEEGTRTKKGKTEIVAPTETVGAIGPRIPVGSVWYGLEIVRYPNPGYKKALENDRPEDVTFGPERVDIVGRDRSGNWVRAGKPELKGGGVALLVAMREGLNRHVPEDEFPADKFLKGALWVEAADD